MTVEGPGSSGAFAFRSRANLNGFVAASVCRRLPACAPSRRCLASGCRSVHSILKFESYLAVRASGSGLIPNSLVAGILAANFFQFPVNPTMAGANLCCNPGAVRANLQISTTVGAGKFFYRGRELFSRWQGTHRSGRECSCQRLVSCNRSTRQRISVGTLSGRSRDDKLLSARARTNN